MYNSLTRIQNVFGFFTSVAFVVAAIIAASDLAAPRTPSGILETTSVQVVKGRPHYYSTKKEEYAIIKFSLEADLSSLFTWNTKQVFVYVTAEWPSSSAGATADGANNTAVIWDSIITSPSADHLSNMPPVALRRLIESTAGRVIDPGRGRFQLHNHKPKYQITHPSGRIAETTDVTLRLHYNVQPWVGALTWDQGSDLGLWKRLADGASAAFSLPPVKRKDGESKTKSKTKSV
ncbi:signal peptidase subunit-domain-containing protein [Biscogniauxia sp. FL1348]|nr:signal peptidase subunit-domain-containing protein [Biscogniauxia sp. FL1348]